MVQKPDTPTLAADADTWTDPDLYAHFGLTDEEIAFIEATIKEMP